VRFRMTPSGSTFFDLLALLAKELVVGADELAQLLGADIPARRIHAERLKEMEHSADEATHAIMKQLNKTFVTPFDRDDIYALASSLDDCMDFMEEAADLIALYEIETLPTGVSDQIAVLQRSAELTADAMPRLRSLGDLEEYWVEVNRLENHADRTYRKLLAEMYAGATDAILLMKLKEIVDTLERAADAFERVANTVETIALKES
jgi:predicted phosphate transport protein (TIGR00153 family)